MRSAVDRLINRLHPRRPLRRSLTRHLAAGLSVTLGALSALAFQALPSDGATARSLVLLGFAGNDALYNYDFLSTSASATNVDWTANMMFRNNAEIDKVKSILTPEFRNEGSVKYALLKDDTSYVWDSDRGMKNPAGTCPSDVHLRLYADGDDRMYNLTDGFYIFGTTHIDWYEGCSGEQFGWSEDAESSFVNRFRNKGYVVWEDCCDWFNWEPLRYQGNHVWDNNGLTSIVNIP
ncbi:MAG: hypothetical protein LC808_24065 [Actinobacteria bacterium]|nr:hypothetical protein [Actinomycetota bacterium]